MKKLFFLFLFYCFCWFGFSPSTAQVHSEAFFDLHGKKVSSRKQAHYYTQSFKTDSNTFVVKGYYVENNKPKSVEHFHKQMRHGTDTAFYANGRLRYIVNFQQDKLQGTAKSYWENGLLKRNDLYENDKLQSGQQFNSDGKEIKFHTDFLLMPEFPGGIAELVRFVASNTRYPGSERKNGTEGIVRVTFTVTAEGKVCDARVVKSVSEKLDEAALKVIARMPDWKPGMVDDRFEPFSFTLPFSYRLQ